MLGDDCPAMLTATALEARLSWLEDALRSVTACRPRNGLLPAACTESWLAEEQRWREGYVAGERAVLNLHAARTHGRFLPCDNSTVLRSMHSARGDHQKWHAEYRAANARMCPLLQRIPQPNASLEAAMRDPTTERAAKWLCAPARLPPNCSTVSLGSNFEDEFELALNEMADCHSYVVDPSLLRGSSVQKAEATLAAFAARLNARGDILNASVGVGSSGGTLKLTPAAREREAPLVSLATLLHDARRRHGLFSGQHANGGPLHVHVLKIDIEGSEFDVLPSVWQLCASGALTIDELLVELHAGGWVLDPSSPFRGRLAREVLAMHEGAALGCGLALHHTEPNYLRSERDIEFSWVSLHFAARAHHFRLQHEQVHEQAQQHRTQRRARGVGVERPGIVHKH
jgi:hypothetical protein